MAVSLWLICSGAFRRRLVIDNDKGEYRFYVHTHLRHRGPLNQIYIRIIAQKSGEETFILMTYYTILLHTVYSNNYAICILLIY